METPFYHDDAHDLPEFDQAAHYSQQQSTKSVNKLTMAAQDFSAPVGGTTRLKLMAEQPGTASNATLSADATDIGLLKLAAPDLEQLILHSGPGLGTGGPGGAGAPPFLYRSPVTNEQEGFADGFVKALADLHKQNQLVGAPPSPSSGGYQRGAGPTELPVYASLSNYGPTTMSTTSQSYPAAPPTYVRPPDEPQTVPEATRPPPPERTVSPPPPPPLSPVDLETQEQIKAERKRMRNRIAASKCRRRKLERISRLEEKVRALKGQNAELASTAGLLRQQVAQLKQKVANHVTSGCQIAVGSAAPPPAEPPGEAPVCWSGGEGGEHNLLSLALLGSGYRRRNTSVDFCN